MVFIPYPKTFLTPTQSEALINAVDTYWTNTYSHITTPQYHVTVEGKRYLLDYWVETREVISISDADLVWSESKDDSDMADILNKEDYIELFKQIGRELNKMYLIDSLDNLDMLPHRHKVLRSEMRKVEYKSS